MTASGILLVDGGDQRLGVADGPNLVPGVSEDVGEPFAQQGGVLSDHQTHGSSTRSTVGPPLGLVRVMSPVEDGDPVAETGQAAA